MTLQLEG